MVVEGMDWGGSGSREAPAIDIDSDDFLDDNERAFLAQKMRRRIDRALRRAAKMHSARKQLAKTIAPKLPGGAEIRFPQTQTG
jgi:hypothetical protein